MAKDAYYFSHDSNARNDIKIMKMRSSKDGLAKYGLYWMIVETLRESSEYSLALDYKTLSWNLHCPVKLIKNVVEDYELFTISSDNLTFFSERLRRSMIYFENKSKKAKDSINKRWNKETESNDSSYERNTNVIPTNYDGNTLNKIKVNEIKENNNKGNESIYLLFSYFNLDQSQVTSNALLRTQKLINLYSYEDIKKVFIHASTLDQSMQNIAYIEGIFKNSPDTSKIQINQPKKEPCRYKDLPIK